MQLISTHMPVCMIYIKCTYIPIIRIILFQLDVLENLRSKVESTHAFTIQCAWIRYVRNKHRRREDATVVLQSGMYNVL